MTKGLRHIPIPMRSVDVAEGVSFTVRGISPNDALGVYFRHAGELGALYDEFAAQTKKTKAKQVDVDVDVRVLGESMVSGAPRVMAEIIAVASDADPAAEDFEENVDIALKLSAGVQIDALEKIAELTFTPSMPPGKFLAVVVKLAGSATAAMTKSLAA